MDDFSRSDQRKPLAERKKSSKPPQDPSSCAPSTSRTNERKRKKPVSLLTSSSKGKAEPENGKKVEDTTVEEEVAGSDGPDDGEEEGNACCYWFDCDNPPRPGSKYCSDSCGIKLAMRRILNILPAKMEELKREPSVASKKNEEELKEIRQTQESLKAKIENLKQQRIVLDDFLQKISTLDESVITKEENSGMEEGYISCVICGYPISVKNFRKHTEKCYNRVEKAVSFDASMPSPGVIAREIICDAYNKVTGRYCKRLSILCPEHKNTACKTYSDRKVCGAPLTDDFNVDEMCKFPKNGCSRHYGWEKLRIAEIDAQRLHILSKSEALMAREQQIRQEMITRMGLLPLLLHNTRKEQ